MATPLKPWERNGAGISPPGASSATQSRSNVTTAGNTKQPGQPAVPPRPNSATTGGYGNGQYAMSRYYNPTYSSYTTGPSYGMYSGGYGGAYGGGYGSSYGYRPYGMYGGSGYGGQEDSAVFRQAEERTRVAFQSVESVVGAVGSISMMLESTYVAVHSCFRALIGVAEHFSRLRNHLWSIVSAISIIQRIKYLLRRLLQFLRLRPYSPTEDAWDDISASASAISLSSQVHQSSQRLWPAVMFFTVIVGVPWLLWRLVTSISTDEMNPTTWSSSSSDGTGGGSTCLAQALYGFTAENNNELTINAGDELVVAPRQFQPNIPGWILVGRNKKSGLVPANYIEILPGSSTTGGTITPGGTTRSVAANSTKNTPSPALTLSDD